MEKAYLSMASNGASKKKGIKKLFGLGLFAATAALSVSLFAGLSASRAPVEVKAISDDETLLLDDEMTIQVTSSASTPTSHSFLCSAISTRIEAFGNGARYNSVFAVTEDPTYPGSLTQASNEAKAAQEAAQEAGEEWKAPRYEAYVYNVFNGGTSKQVVIPKSIGYSNKEYFFYDITSIRAEACKNHSSGEISYKNVQSIVIPSTVTYIEADAFVGAKEAGVKIYLEAENDDGFDEGWTDTEDITYGYDLSGIADSALNPQSTLSRSFGEGADFVIGMNREGAQYPFQARYRLLDEQDNQVGDYRVIDLPVTSSNADYDAVGYLIGKSPFDFSVDIPLERGLHVDDKSLTFHNIYSAIRVDAPDGKGKVTVPDLDSGVRYCEPHFSFANSPKFDDIFENRPGSLSSFGDYTKVGLIVKRKLSAYEELMPRFYNQYKALIEKGTYAIRHQFTTLSQASYNITYEYNGTLITKKVKVSTPISNANIDTNGDYEVGFLIHNSDVGEGFDASTVREIKFEGFSVKLDLLNTEKNSILTKSNATVRFASLVLLDQNEAKPNANVNISLITALVFIIYVIVYAVLAVVYYFYAKNKYKNDEFRRVNGKKYLKSTIKNGVGLGILVGAIFFIYARWGLFDSSVVVYNPLDVLVIIFSIAGLIYAGFAIKNIVTSIKNNRKRKEAARLHLDEDKDEDGTN